MMEWEPGPMYFYSDPDGDESGVIASIHYPYRGGERVANFVIISTDDRAQAERWRSAFAAGGRPNLKADPPIRYPRSPEFFEECIRFLREAGDL